MKDIAFVFFTVFIATAIIYFLYKFILGIGNGKKDDELQITSEEILEHLNILYKEKNYSIVINIARKYLEKKPSNCDVKTILAKALFDSKRYTEAAEQAQQITRIQPNNIQMKIFLGNCYLNLSRHADAIFLFEDILKIDPENVVAIKELAQIYHNTNQKKSAIKMYKRLEPFMFSNQEKVRIKTVIAQLYSSFGEYDEAIEQYREILEIYPLNIDIKRKIIDIYKTTGNNTKLIDTAIEIINTQTNDENDLWAMRILSETFLKVNNYEKSLEYAQLMKEHPLADKNLATQNIAKILRESGQIDESIEVLAELLDTTPKANKIAIKQSLAKSFEAKQLYEAATDTYKEILDDAGVEEIKKIHFEMSNIYSNWAMHLFAQGDNPSCFKKFSIAMQYDSENPQVYHNLGIVNQSIKNFNEAIAQFKKALELDEINSEYQLAIADCYGEMDNIYEQKKALLETLKIDSQNAKAHYKLGLVQDKQRDYAGALQSVKKALEIDPNMLDAKYLLALLYEHQGKKDEAIEIYENIIKFNPEHEGALKNLKMLKS